jgi:hypothetical protein
MRPTIFRLLVVLLLLFDIAAMSIDDVFSLVPPSLAIASDNELAILLDSYPFWVSIALVVLVVFSMISELASMIGMFYFKRWARVLAVYSLLATICAVPFMGALAYSGVAIAFGTIYNTLLGAVLALAYFSPPIKTRFEGEQTV